MRAIHPSRLFHCELQSLGDISRRDVCFLSNIMELDRTRLVVPKAKKTKPFEKLMSLSRNHNQKLKIIHSPRCK